MLQLGACRHLNCAPERSGWNKTWRVANGEWRMADGELLMAVGREKMVYFDLIYRGVLLTIP
jgi:hypothetical protein